MTLPNAPTKPLRVCICTTNEAAAEPRAPRHAAALAQQSTNIEVIFIDAAPFANPRRPVKALADLSNLTWRSHYYSTRASKPLRRTLDHVRQLFARWLFKLTGVIRPEAISSCAIGLERLLNEVAADIYFAHEIAALLSVCRIMRKRHAVAMFDSMEFHSDMGQAQSAIDKELTRATEQRCLSQCSLVLASSDQVADELAKEYGIPRPLAVYNVPLMEDELPVRSDDTFSLYWRNAVIGLGPRGLDLALIALTKLPSAITLHLQGRLPSDHGVGLGRRIRELGINDRVIMHQPFVPGEAVKEAAKYTIGLCLEQRDGRNHELTVSSKIFDYHMAGLVVVASNLAGLRAVLERSKGGLLFEPGSADDLAAKILLLYRDVTLRSELARNARDFALREGNWSVESKKFIAAFTKISQGQVPMEQTV